MKYYIKRESLIQNYSFQCTILPFFIAWQHIEILYTEILRDYDQFQIVISRFLPIVIISMWENYYFKNTSRQDRVFYLQCFPIGFSLSLGNSGIL